MAISYSKHMEKLTKEKLLEGLIGHGLFPEKLPPFLSSEDFYEFCMDSNNYPTGNNNSGFFKYTHISGYIKYESMRNINVPRILAIPEPIAYFNLCHCLSENWNELVSYFKDKTENDKFKVSRVHVRQIKQRKYIFTMGDDYNLSEIPLKLVKRPIPKIFLMNHKDLNEDDKAIQKMKIGKRYLVQADISNCFGSIYTHALSWALVGKERGKTERKGHWHNKIDTFTMNLNNGETHGILIGAHALNIISEIILTAVDNNFSSKYDYVRYIDDYSCYVEDYQTAEQFLVDLESELRNFGLTLNHKKTKIINLPISSEEDWIKELKYFKQGYYYNYNDTVCFLDNAVKLMQTNGNNLAILNYAIKMLSNKNKSKSATEYFLDTIHHLVLIYPYLITLIEKNVFSSINDDKQKKEYIKSISEDVYKIGLEKNYYEAIGYALYLSIKYDFKLSATVFEDLKQSRDAILYLLGYLHDKKFINHSSVTKKYKRLADQLYENEFDEFWIFIYEIFPKSKFKKKGANNIDWKNMKEQNVSFLKEDFRV